MNKKIFMYFIIILLIGLVFTIGWIAIKNKNKDKLLINKEYTPVEEITTEQLRRTNIVLYYLDKNTGELGTEIRQIDSKELLQEPARKLIEFLMSEPQDENLQTLIPKETKLLNTEIIKEILYIDFSPEFINEEKSTVEDCEKMINSILKTVNQLNEIKGIKILINNEKNKEYFNGEIKL